MAPKTELEELNGADIALARVCINFLAAHAALVKAEMKADTEAEVLDTYDKIVAEQRVELGKAAQIAITLSAKMEATGHDPQTEQIH